MSRNERRRDSVPTVNRHFRLEPELFSRIRWGMGAEQILKRAQAMYGDRPYNLARGDMDVIVLPAKFIPELNLLSPSLINTREFHSYTLLGHITGIDIVRKTGFHVKILLSRITPAINRILDPMAHRMAAAISRNLSHETQQWITISPLSLYAEFVSEGVSLMFFGSPACDNPDVVRLCHHHTESIFTIVFIMRFVPSYLQSTLVWLLPWKWNLARSWKKIEKISLSEIQRRREQIDQGDGEDAISWMVRDGETDLERDPQSLSRLIGALLGGSTYSTASLVTSVVANLTAHPELLDEIRQEIRQKDDKVHGMWNKTTFNSLPKLDSVLKETARLAPSAVLLYSRHMEDDYTLSNGLKLHKGQKVTVNSLVTSMDPKLYKEPEKFIGLRHCEGQPFQAVDNNLLTWGSGRWACPGRFVANIMAKIILVKLLNDYEFQFADGKQPRMFNMHEFVVPSPFNRMKVRRRKDTMELSYNGQLKTRV
ncbi:putative cytochrome P450 [Xylaria longipes]|nr:putative cytochrome P450 [Xylaria longipes]